MKRLMMLSALGAAVLAVPVTNVVWAKAHVPINRVQVCTTQGITKTVSASALGALLKRGACRLPTCDFNNVFQNRDPCPSDGDGDGFCDLENDRDSANGVTPACTSLF